MKPFYWTGTKNFGDYINTWLWPRLLPECLAEDDNIRLVGIGSLLKGSLNYLKGTKVIFGTGSGYGTIPPRNEFKDWKFYFVRGPLTARCFSLDGSAGIVDGAWLISQLPEFKTVPTTKSGAVFIPHWTSSDSGVWREVCSMAGITFVDPQGDLHAVLQAIGSSEVVITESLHGAIFADYFRTPWIPVRMSPKFLNFKWVDWFQSVGLEPSIRTLPYSDLFEHLYYGVLPKNEEIDISPQVIHADLRHVAPAETDAPGLLYKQRIRLKQAMRAGRRSAIQACVQLRDVYPFRKWNKNHQKKLASALFDLTSVRPFMSSDAVRAEKIQQLADVTEQLRRDYASGSIRAESN